jgi:hypothetical protein
MDNITSLSGQSKESKNKLRQVPVSKLKNDEIINISSTTRADSGGCSLNAFPELCVHSIQSHSNNNNFK